MKRVLMITYYFPPIGGPGVYRSLKFCKYLPECGWQLTVIAGHRKDPDFAPDDTLLVEIPPLAEVHRLDFPWGTPWRRTRKWLFGHRLGRIGHHLGFLFDFPCRFRQWSRLAMRCAAQVVEKHRPDVIYTTSPPFSAHCVGLELKQRFGVPWVADFRDPWIGNPILMKTFPRWQLARQSAAEARVAVTADACVFAHPIVASEFATRHRLPPGKTHAITNGYDLDDFNGSTKPEVRNSRRVLFVHVGTFYGDYNPMPLRRALEQATTQKPDLLNQISLAFVGGCPTRFDDLPGLEVEIQPRLPHAAAIQWMGQADVLMTILPKLMGEYCIPGKIFEYLAARRPLLAIVPVEGSTAKIVRETRTGIVANPDDPDEILLALEKCVSAARNPLSAFRPDEDVIGRYSRKNLTGQLARIFEQVGSARR